MTRIDRARVAGVVWKRSNSQLSCKKRQYPALLCFVLDLSSHYWHPRTEGDTGKGSVFGPFDKLKYHVLVSLLFVNVNTPSMHSLSILDLWHAHQTQFIMNSTNENKVSMNLKMTNIPLDFAKFYCSF